MGLLALTSACGWGDSAPSDEDKRIVASWLAEVPLPAGMGLAAAAKPYDADSGDIEAEIGNVFGPIVCRWLRDWTNAREHGDRVTEVAAVRALQALAGNETLARHEAYAEGVVEYAEAVAGSGMVMGGDWISVEESYDDAYC